jgi:hypothetical protein
MHRVDPETQTHIYEPFFTSRGTGKGTGMGLAIVLGIAEQSGGTVWRDSEVGKGTRFKFLLPATTAASDPEERPAGGVAEAPKGSEVVLLVEDEDQVRKLASEFLQGCGYVVLEARDGREGLSVCEAHQGKIDLLLSDVVMPELGGREPAERILPVRPDMRFQKPEPRLEHRARSKTRPRLGFMRRYQEGVAPTVELRQIYP